MQLIVIQKEERSHKIESEIDAKTKENGCLKLN